MLVRVQFYGPLRILPAFNLSFSLPLNKTSGLIIDVDVGKIKRKNVEFHVACDKEQLKRFDAFTSSVLLVIFRK